MCAISKCIYETSSAFFIILQCSDQIPLHMFQAQKDHEWVERSSNVMLTVG